MLKRILKAAIGLTVVSAGALAVGAVALANRRIDGWETLSLDDAGDGDFVSLSDGARIHYIARGLERESKGGSSVILIHGLMDSAQHWAKNIGVLAREHPVWAIDLIGFGFSSRVTEPKYSLRYFARSLREFMDAQGIERAGIVGHSLGGAVTLNLRVLTRSAWIN
jgi:hypothetical protein